VVTTSPATADDAAALLAHCVAQHRRVAICGGGTKSEWGCRLATPDVVLSTLSLHRVVAHRHGDLTATLEAGARLDDVNRELARHGQWLPLDPPWSDRATIGGIVATNDAGPRRHRYGTPRDLIIGVEIARADGVRAKAGGIVVKNVAGYDLARLMTGSFGSLALITSATFKLYPLAAASRTVLVDLPSDASVGSLMAALNGSHLTPTAVEVQSPPLRALIRFESTPVSVEAQSAAAAAMATSAGGAARIVDGDDETRQWRAHLQRPWAGDGSVVKIAMLPADLDAVLGVVRRAAGDMPLEIVGRGGLGILLVRLEGDVDARSRAISLLRKDLNTGRASIVVLRADRALSRPDATDGAAAVMQSIRRAFDPSGVFANRCVE
jgi:glycolate dehydrogenase FAD-binding subunit